MYFSASGKTGFHKLPFLQYAQQEAVWSQSLQFNSCAGD
jgi:hypothetical protein